MRRKPSGFTHTNVTGWGAGCGPGAAGAPRLETGNEDTGVFADSNALRT